jgi:PTS system nitrogen regulatory IIA component
LFQVLLARESLGSTALGNGVAVPHVRNPIVLHIQRPMVTLCFLEQAIESLPSTRCRGGYLDVR